MSARCSRDVIVRRNIDAVVHEIRTEIAKACTAMADQVSEPPLEQQADCAGSSDFDPSRNSQ
jgi:hypothetical protein